MFLKYNIDRFFLITEIIGIAVEEYKKMHKNDTTENIDESKSVIFSGFFCMCVFIWVLLNKLLMMLILFTRCHKHICLAKEFIGVLDTILWKNPHELFGQPNLST